jgi:hypothetical protein
MRGLGLHVMEGERRPERPAGGLLEWEVKGKRGRRGGVRCFIEVESSTGPVHAPYPKRGVAKPGGANTATEITILKSRKADLVIN